MGAAVGAATAECAAYEEHPGICRLAAAARASSSSSSKMFNRLQVHEAWGQLTGKWCTVTPASATRSKKRTVAGKVELSLRQKAAPGSRRSIKSIRLLTLF